ncbi:hypothetical protein MPTK1_1g08560 [Marchantia polymorpha subsp. ruderalis]|uniref:Protein kinase domain-containing protein n=2 Tax=Marchantia polymorpha TaxID=3197 RepID=A0AAF6AMZ4_MARPO|nr:hypothetical protein MARPO_0036s0099 [Marchantia polymorpha]BAF79957.1 receptor-like kinase [Marchantia polymorpha]BBM97814.1 hypothetical protein Mp_1g08560 [Marchantia polymorpha subsp. ruderalis]|eukprot:PTQ41117.1 hypothetical protein MARPO_0036s0099 [Marchantia polymorpha]
MMAFVAEGYRVPYLRIASALLALAVIACFPVSSAERSGLSFACGAPEGFTTNSVLWKSDKDIAPAKSKIAKIGTDYVRYFSEYSDANAHQNLHCYDKLPSITSEGPILLRVTFEYSNYDGLDAPPEFQMWVGASEVAYVNLKKDDPWVEEAVLKYSSDSSTQVLCLVAVKGAPAISFIELRPLPADAYSAGHLLRTLKRIDCGNDNATRRVRFPQDVYDRIWDVDANFPSNSDSFASKVTIDGEDVPERPPMAVLETSRVPSSGTRLAYKFDTETTGFFEIKVYTPSTIPSTLNVNGVSSTESPVVGREVQVTSVSRVPDSSGGVEVVLQGSNGLKPQINALEVFQEIDGIFSNDADAINAIKAYYNIVSNWFGDPCLPVPWNGLECSSDSRVTSLDLSGQNLIKPMNPKIKSLTRLKSLNMSFNKFDSKIPDLTGLINLQVLDLRKNDFFGNLDVLSGLSALTQLDVSFNPRLSGETPSALKRTNLQIDAQGTCVDQPAGCNLSPSPEVSSLLNKNRTGLIVGVVVAVVLAILLALVICIFLIWRRKKPRAGRGEVEGGVDLRNWTAAKVFTFKELETATNHFKKKIGEGSFGPVYLGVLSNGQKVAIKMRHDTSALGADAFANEVYLLSRVNHPNLVSLLGYCQEGKNQYQLLVYEFMPGGTLMDHLYGTMVRLDWITRLRIAIGAATGISYLHNGSDPKIIHRDVKSTNILLDNNLMAKVSDFGLSKLVTRTEATHVTTLVKGTAGYLDPEYFTTNQLTEKSDVYSFGVVLLEIICGREPLTGNRAPDEYNLIAWAKPYLLAKTYEGIVDRGLQNNYNSRSMSLVASLALRCIERDSKNRPTMLQVLRELEEALQYEDRPERTLASPSQPDSAAFDFKSTASDTPPDSAPQLANVPSFTFPR